MTAFLIAMLLSALASPAATPGQKPRTLAQLIELAVTEGQPSKLPAVGAKELGLGEQDIPTRRLRYPQSTTPDKLEHTLAVLLKTNDGKETPFSMILTVASGKRVNGVVVLDGLAYLSDLEGEVKKLRRNYGPVGLIKSVEQPLTPATKRQFKKELDFFLKVVPALGLVHSK